MAVIGRNAAVVQYGKMRFKGFSAWLMWSTLHLFKLLGVRNKLNIFINWVWQYTHFDNGVKVILTDKIEEEEQSLDFELIIV